LEHGGEAPELLAPAGEGTGASAQGRLVEVDPHDPGTSFERPEAVTALAAARVEEKLTRADVKPLEIDRE
jgi:hypothetical protein